MWVEYIKLQNIKSFEDLTIELGTSKKPYKWVTLLGENGGGKSTVLQALALLLAGHSGVSSLLPRPQAWVRNTAEKGVIETIIHQSKNDETVDDDKKNRSRKYAYYVTTNEKIELNGETYTEPSFVEVKDNSRTAGLVTWLRKNTFNAKIKGWFSAGYGAFRRLNNKENSKLPTKPSPSRFDNFITQFKEDETLVAFEQWIYYLNVKANLDDDDKASKQKGILVEVFNRVLPDGVYFDSISSDGQVWFNVKGVKIPTINLSDGYRSILSLCGDLTYRLIMAFPDSEEPLKEEGIVLIDELDIHLHPIWQWEIAQRLRDLFPNIQFIVATHSPLIAAGVGDDAVTYKLQNKKVEKIENLASKNVEAVLESEAFQMVSTYSYEVNKNHKRYEELKHKENKTKEEEKEFVQLKIFEDRIFSPTSEWEKQRNEYLKNKGL